MITATTPAGAITKVDHPIAICSLNSASFSLMFRSNTVCSCHRA